MSDDKLSRRTLLKATAVGTLAVGASGKDAARSDSGSRRVLVVGAGAFGSWTALQLLRGGADVTLVDAWGPGNSRSSSGGESRFIRSIYGPDRIYSEMVQRSFEHFQALDRTTGLELYRETGALWMFSGDDDYARQSLPILEELGFPVENLDPDEAGKRWPQMSFAGVESLFFEARAGVLSAREICRVVTALFISAGGTYLTAHVEPEAAEGGSLSAVRSTSGERFEADDFVFCCGPWLGTVFPELIGDAIFPSRQEVYYFGPPAGDSRFDIGELPGWIDFDETLFYGFPRTFGRGLKIADDTRGERFDPTSGERVPSPDGVDRARAFVERRFPGMTGAPLLESRVCQYENSPDGDLIVDRHPEAANCWVVGGGSGHGFKLAPAVGELVAQVILEGGELEPRFKLQRLSAIDQSTTQFD